MRTLSYIINTITTVSDSGFLKGTINGNNISRVHFSGNPQHTTFYVFWARRPCVTNELNLISYTLKLQQVSSRMHIFECI